MSVIEQLQQIAMKHGTKLSVLMLLDILDLIHAQRREAIEQHDQRSVRLQQR